MDPFLRRLFAGDRLWPIRSGILATLQSHLDRFFLPSLETTTPHLHILLFPLLEPEPSILPCCLSIMDSKPKTPFSSFAVASGYVDPQRGLKERLLKRDFMASTTGVFGTKEAS
jgi:hypothetical protein